MGNCKGCGGGINYQEPITGFDGEEIAHTPAQRQRSKNPFPGWKSGPPKMFSENVDIFWRQVAKLNNVGYYDTEHWVDDITLMRRLAVCGGCERWAETKNGGGCLEAAGDCMKCVDEERQAMHDAIASKQASCPLKKWSAENGNSLELGQNDNQAGESRGMGGVSPEGATVAGGGESSGREEVRPVVGAEGSEAPGTAEEGRADGRKPSRKKAKSPRARGKRSKASKAPVNRDRSSSQER